MILAIGYLFKLIKMMKFVVFSSLLVAALAAPQHHLRQSGGDPKLAQIVQFTSDITPEGSYKFGFQTNHGIQHQESANIQVKSLEQADKKVQGSYSYISPEGEQITINYVADENGFQPSGSHLPTAPPVPEAILKSLEYNKAHPQPQEPVYQQRVQVQQPLRFQGFQQPQRRF